MRARWGELLLLGASGLVCLVGGELFVRAFIPVWYVGPDFSEYHPEYGKALRRSVSVDRLTPEYTMHLTTNAEGLRGPERTATATGAVWCLGDSFTMGFGVEDGEDFPALLRAEAARRRPQAPVEVLNAGVGAIGSGSWLRRLEAEIDTRRPRLVILQLTSNDYADNLSEGMFTLDEGGALVDGPRPVPRGLLVRAYSLVAQLPGADQSWLIAAIKQAISTARRELPRVVAAARVAASGASPLRTSTSTSTSGPVRPRHVEALTEAIVARAVDACARRGIPVVGLGAELGSRDAAAMRALFTARGGAWVDGPPDVPGSPLHYTNDRHWNAAGHVEVARRLLETPSVSAALGQVDTATTAAP